MALSELLTGPWGRFLLASRRGLDSAFDPWQVKGPIKKPDWVRTEALGTSGGAKTVRATSRAGRPGRGLSAHTSFLLG